LLLNEIDKLQGELSGITANSGIILLLGNFFSERKRFEEYFGH